MKLIGSAAAAGKINLRLKVTARRPDGYHDLDTIFCPLDFPADKVELFEKQHSGISFECAAFPGADHSKNLAVRAAEAFAAAAGISAAWHIVLEKNLPIAAGVGGGSSDAAAVLDLLNARYECFGEETLSEIALSLGADVPFFLRKRPMRATGVGEKLTDFIIPAEMPEILLVYPGFPVSARWAYCNLKPEYIGVDREVAPEEYAAAFAAPEDADWEFLVRNDLAFALWKKFPICCLLRQFILEHGSWCAQISGSGSSLFALFPDRERAVECGKALRASEFGSTPCTRIFAGGCEL